MLTKQRSQNEKPKECHSKVFICCIAPIAEEVIFRAIFLMTIADYTGKSWAIVLTALLFSLLHLKPRLILKAFIVGVMLGAVTIVTETIIVAIVIHIVLNYSSMYRADNRNLQAVV